MIYSVFDWHNGKYKYYADGRKAGVAPQPAKRAPRKSTQIGVAPDDIVVLVPKDAKLVGEGQDAKGVVAALGDDSGSSVIMGVVLLGLVVWGFSKVAKKI